MRAAERRKRILAYLEKRGAIGLAEVMDAFGVSPATARRDFAALARDGLVERRRREVRRRHVPAGGEIPLGIRAAQFEAEKDAILREACRLLKPDDVVFVDVGSTFLRLACHLPRANLRIITNFLPLALALAEARARLPNLELTMLGGSVYPQSFYTCGPATVRAIAPFRAHWAFISPNSLAEDHYGEVNEDVAENQRAMIAASDRTLLAATHNKFDARSLVRAHALDRRFTVVTDAWAANEPRLKRLEQRGVDVRRARR